MEDEEREKKGSQAVEGLSSEGICTLPIRWDSGDWR